MGRTPQPGSNRFGTDSDTGASAGALPTDVRRASDLGAHWYSGDLLSQSVDLEFIALDGDAAAMQRPGLGQGDEGCA